MQQGVVPDALIEFGELGRRWQLAVDQQPRCLEVRRLLGDLVDRVTAVAQNSFVTVDKGDVRPCCGRVDKAVVESGEAGLLRQCRDVKRRSALNTLQNRKLRCAAGECQRRLLLLAISVAHGASLSSRAYGLSLNDQTAISMPRYLR